MRAEDYEDIRKFSIAVFESGFRKKVDSQFLLYFNKVVNNEKSIYSYMPLLCLSTIAFSLKKGVHIDEQIQLYQLMKTSGYTELVDNANTLKSRLLAQLDIITPSQRIKLEP
jgi:hypothetical protein